QAPARLPPSRGHRQVPGADPAPWPEALRKGDAPGQNREPTGGRIAGQLSVAGFRIPRFRNGGPPLRTGPLLPLTSIGDAMARPRRRSPMNATTATRSIGGGEITVESGKLAKQAGGAALVTIGETQVLATCTSSNPREGIDFFP